MTKTMERVVESVSMVVAIVVGGVTVFLVGGSWWQASLLSLAIYALLIGAKRLFLLTRGRRNGREASERGDG